MQRDSSLPIHERLIKAGEEVRKRRETEIEERRKHEIATNPKSPYVSVNSEKIILRKQVSPSDTLKRLTDDDIARRKQWQLAMGEKAEEELRKQTEIQSHMSEQSRLIAERLEASGMSTKQRIMASTESKLHLMTAKQGGKEDSELVAKVANRPFVTSMAFTPVNEWAETKDSFFSPGKRSLTIHSPVTSPRGSVNRGEVSLLLEAAAGAQCTRPIDGIQNRPQSSFATPSNTTRRLSDSTERPQSARRSGASAGRPKYAAEAVRSTKSMFQISGHVKDKGAGDTGKQNKALGEENKVLQKVTNHHALPFQSPPFVPHFVLDPTTR